MKRTIIAILSLLLALLSPQVAEPEVVPLLSSGVTNLTSLTLSGNLSATGGTADFASGAIANVDLAAPNAFFAIPVFWSTQITNTAQEVWHTQIPFAFTPYSLTLSIGTAAGHPAGTAKIRIWDDGVSVGLINEVAPSAATYYQGVVTGTVAASSVFTVEVLTADYGLTDSQITIWGRMAHQ